MGTQIYINTWRKRAEDQLRWGDSENWSDQDFEKLAEMFLDKTGTMLSITTLKRIWGRVKYDSSPNAATLNTLAKFLGYADWRSFKQSMDAEKPQVAADKTSPQKNYVPVAMAGVVLLAAIGSLIAWSIKPNKAEKKLNDAPVKFESKKVTDDLPNSVVFNYDASWLNTDSITLQQSWDPSRSERISSKGKQHTSIYYYPGYFTAKLIAGGKVKKETPVFIKTKGWAGIIEKEPIPTYLSADEIKLSGSLGISSKVLANKTVSPVFNDLPVSFYNVQEFEGLNGSDFTFETTLRNTSEPGESLCRNIMVYVLGKRSAVIIPLSAKGCISNLGLYTSSEQINGKETDLSAFGCDFNEFQQLKFGVKNMRLNVFLNNKHILDESITQSIGDIIGIRIRFEGSGAIRNIKLSNSNQTFLNEKF
ncbi:hypothetical protein [Mucilaginibacter segetis]|uniref:Uncharacterized protein n=1 Tax=Mucilaginibacter segetis TaxID=2793071 RepID=A0A934UKX3_9SPHI|nr:hypothetical protein [Mucilaginibacter segetis]MBK0377754.1 hypothetical protein [Mucilaginibacter segetis]